MWRTGRRSTRAIVFVEASLDSTGASTSDTAIRRFPPSVALTPPSHTPQRLASCLGRLESKRPCRVQPVTIGYQTFTGHRTRISREQLGAPGGGLDPPSIRLQRPAFCQLNYPGKGFAAARCHPQNGVWVKDLLVSEPP